MQRLAVEFLDDAAFDAVQALPEPHCDVAWELLKHLAGAPFYGKPLEASPSTGDLTGTRSIYVIDFAQTAIDWPPPYRIVYRVLPGERAPERVQVIWAGRRDDLAVYRTAARRLGR